MQSDYDPGAAADEFNVCRCPPAAVGFGEAAFGASPDFAADI
jgi:hypothetical protein